MDDLYDFIQSITTTTGRPLGLRALIKRILKEGVDWLLDEGYIFTPAYGGDVGAFTSEQGWPLEDGLDMSRLNADLSYLREEIAWRR